MHCPHDRANAVTVIFRDFRGSPEADIGLHGGTRRKGPTADIAKRLLDHLVGASDQCWRHGDAERLRGIEIKRQFVPDRCLDRQIGRLLATKHAIDVRSLRVRIECINSDTAHNR